MNRVRVFEGNFSGKGVRVGIVASRFNDFVTSRLLESAVETLVRNGVGEDQIEIARVPGAFEIPLVSKKMALSQRFDAILCLGAVIRGETPHFEYVSAEVSRGIAEVSLEVGVPLIHGVLTTDTVEQAIERSGGRAKNKGEEAALAALEMVNLIRGLKP